MSSTDLDRLRSICGRLASDYDGERASAALLATRLIHSHNLRWSDVIAAPLPAVYKPTPEPVGWTEKRRFCEEQSDILTDWERKFISSLRGFMDPSPKQRAVLDRLYEKCGGRP